MSQLLAQCMASAGAQTLMWLSACGHITTMYSIVMSLYSKPHCPYTGNLWNVFFGFFYSKINMMFWWGHFWQLQKKWVLTSIFVLYRPKAEQTFLITFHFKNEDHLFYSRLLSFIKGDMCNSFGSVYSLSCFCSSQY